MTDWKRDAAEVDLYIREGRFQRWKDSDSHITGADGEYVDIARVDFQSQVEFTMLWTRRGQWEGRNHPAGCGKRLRPTRTAGETACPTTDTRRFTGIGGAGIQPARDFRSLRVQVRS